MPFDLGDARLPVLQPKRHVDTTVLRVEMREHDVERVACAPQLAHRLLGGADRMLDGVAVPPPVLRVARRRVEHTDDQRTLQSTRIELGRPCTRARCQTYRPGRIRRRCRHGHPRHELPHADVAVDKLLVVLGHVELHRANVNAQVSAHQKHDATTNNLVSDGAARVRARARLVAQLVQRQHWRTGKEQPKIKLGPAPELGDTDQRREALVLEQLEQPDRLGLRLTKVARIHLEH